MDVLIVEDEKIVADNLHRLLMKIDNSVNVVKKTGTIRDTIEWLQVNDVDLIFSDIHLSDGLCFKIFENIEVNTPIIFTTAYDQYAIKAFKLNSVDYILKPIDIEKLTLSLNKYKKLFKENTYKKLNLSSLIESIENRECEYKKRFVTSIGNKIKVFDIADIAYFYILEKSVFLKTNEDLISVVDYNLNELETMLSPKRFFRINRKYIISIKSIKNMCRIAKSRIRIELQPNVPEEIFISSKKSTEFKNWLNQ